MRCFYFLAIVLLLCLRANAQTTRTVQQQINTIATYNSAHAPEKIYIHTNKQNYNKEDTIWFKAYVFDATTMGAPTKSGLMYIEVVNDANRVVNRNLVSLTAGVGWGNIPLVENRFPEGTYTLRAYTNWMRNFDEHYIYSRQFTIEGPLDEDWMINSRFELANKQGINNVKADLAFFTNEGHKMFAEELKAKISAGKRTLYRTNLTTGTDGTLAFDFNLPDKTSAQQLNISLTKKRTKQAGEVTFNVPVVINREEKTDLQFMPEGGNLISGMVNNVAFKAINEEGKGVNVQGEVYNSKGQKITDFNSIHLGMGAFKLQPEPGETYTARINYNEKQLSFPLPQAKTSGLMMNVENDPRKDSIFVTITPSADIKQAGGLYYLIGQSPSLVCYGASVNVAKGTRRFGIHRKAFPTGVIRFTLLSALNAPVAERIIFVDQHDRINISIAPSKPQYGSRDSVTLNITAKNKDGAPVAGTFSLTVTDDAQVKPDAAALDLPAKVLLTDDLKGYLENAGWYFVKGDTLAQAKALDVLLLTQGWVAYNWANVFKPEQSKTTYPSEPFFAVKGRVTNAFGQAVGKSNIVLFSTKPTFVTDTTTNKAGEFIFTDLPHNDTVAYNLQAKNKRGRMFNVGIDVEEFVPPVFADAGQRIIPPYVNIDTGKLNALRKRALYNQEEAKLTGRQLMEVQIKAKKGVKDSKSLVGPGEADFTLNEEDLREVAKKSLLDVIYKNIKGFTNMGKKGGIYYNIYFMPTIFIIDGKSTLFFVPEGTSYYQYMKSILEYINAEDVKGVELMTSSKNQLAYTSEYISPKYPLAKYTDFTFIEITTYSGNGIFMKKTPGSYLYRPPVFASTQEFYSPKYIVKNPVVVPDTRPAIYWEPNVMTDNNGRATVSFYTADKAATYSLNIQGADMAGAVGNAQGKLTVK